MSLHFNLLESSTRIFVANVSGARVYVASAQRNLGAPSNSKEVSPLLGSATRAISRPGSATQARPGGGI